MPTVQQDVAAIRTAVYGRDVREAIADGIEHCYNDAEGGIQRANTAADNADTAAQNVNAAVQNAVTATGAANAAANAANTAAQNANTAAQDTTEAVQNGIQRFQEELDRKARIDGYYQDLTAGNAEQLISTQFVEDKAIYSMRRAGGSADVEDREYLDKIIGGTVAWNQLADQTSVISKTFDANTTTYFGTIGELLHSINIISGHKYFVSGIFTRTISGNNEITVGFVNQNSQVKITLNNGGANGLHANVCQAVGDYNGPNCLYNNYAGKKGFSAGDTITVDKLVCIDLTQMFGSTIADYIYSLEQAHAGDGVAFFRKLFPKPYYAYNPGELISVNASAHKMVGFNAWDEEWEVGGIDSNGNNASANNTIRSKNKISVIPNAIYYIKSSAGLWVWGYDANQNYIGRVPNDQRVTNNTMTIPSNVHFLRFVEPSNTTYNHDICINLSWDGERDGEYEPYTENVYPLGNVELRGIPKLDANSKLVFDGDTYESDGTVTRKYGIVDLGTLMWTHSGNSSFRATGEQINGVAGTGAAYLAKAICSKYPITTTGNVATVNNTLAVGAYYSAGCNVYVKDTAYTDAAAFKTAMSGVMLVYELATPTTEESDPFVAQQKVDDFGTEEYIDRAVEAGDRDVSMPVGHHTLYQANLRAKLEMAPNSPDGDGDYVVRQTSGENEYVPLVPALAPVLATKANTDGNYNQMTVGNAEQLVATVGIEDQVPYTFRTAGGSADIGDRENDAIVGGTVAWNQWIKNGNFASGMDSWACSPNTNPSVSNNILTFTPQAQYNAAIINIAPALKYNHKYIQFATIKVGTSTSSIAMGVGDNVNFTIAKQLSVTTSFAEYYYLFNISSQAIAAQPQAFIRTTATTNFTPISITNVMLIDLTQMFGSAIADYIYSLETAHAGDGVAWFRKLFPKPYYEYNPGELLSVEGLQSHDMTGFNQWDEEWEPGDLNTNTGGNYPDSNRIRSKNYIPIFPNTQYFFKSPNGATVCYYDVNKQYITPNSTLTANGTFTTYPKAYYMRFAIGSAYGGTYKNDVCIHLAWDGERNGEYEPYTLHSYPLDSDLVLRGIPKLDSNNKLYYDGDEYQENGMVKRRYKELLIDENLQWIKDGDANGYNRYYFEDDDIKRELNYKGLLLNSKGYENASAYSFSYSNENVAITLYSAPETTNAGKNRFYIGLKTSLGVDTLNALKTWLATNNFTVVVKLATPTTETAEPFSDPQIVNDWGTEEYVTDSIVPVGHKTNYQPNLRAKLEMAPDSPEGDGDYIVRQSNGENTYVPLVIPNELPTMPSSNGTYVLKVTVANGTPTLSWVAG